MSYGLRLMYSFLLLFNWFSGSLFCLVINVCLFVLSFEFRCYYFNLIFFGPCVCWPFFKYVYVLVALIYSLFLPSIHSILDCYTPLSVVLIAFNLLQSNQFSPYSYTNTHRYIYILVYLYILVCKLLFFGTVWSSLLISVIFTEIFLEIIIAIIVKGQK